MRRAVRVTLKFATARKRRAINALLSRYRAAVNFYIRSLWKERGGLNAATLNRLSDTELSVRYKSQALKQAIEIVVATRKAAKLMHKRVQCPVFRGLIVLDAKFVTIEEGRGSFDLVIRLSSLVPGQRIMLPTRKTAVLNKWLAMPGARLIQGCALSEDRLVLWVEIPDAPLRADGEMVALDIGMNKMLSDSSGNHWGRDFKAILLKICGRRPGSKGRQRTSAERKNYIGRTLNRLPWKRLSVVGVEALADMKRGKRKNRSKAFRKAVAPWLYRQVLTQIEQHAQANRVRLVRVDPANTSRTCPSCGGCDKLNRRGEDFLCIACGHQGDADTIGARNILARTLATLGSVESPRLERSMI